MISVSVINIFGSSVSAFGFGCPWRNPTRWSSPTYLKLGLSWITNLLTGKNQVKLDPTHLNLGVRRVAIFLLEKTGLNLA